LSELLVCGCGAVSPAGWGVVALREALAGGEPLPARDFPRPGWTKALRVRSVPAPPARPAFFTHARLRRTSPIAQFGVAAALEALGSDHEPVIQKRLRLGIVLCVMSGCVNYSRRFYDETLKSPATASPLVFPETVFNAPASHLASLLGASGMNYTLVGDPSTFLQGLALAGEWLADQRVDGCLVIGAEEIDWMTAEAFAMFQHNVIVGDGAAAVYLRNAGTNPLARVQTITNPFIFSKNQTRMDAARRARAELGPPLPGELLCDGLLGDLPIDRAERKAWQDWPTGRLSPKTILGEGLAAGGGWQCVAAIDALHQGRAKSVTVSLVGCNQQAIAARFLAADQ